MSEKKSVQDLIEQINNLSNQEKAELAKQLDLKEMISFLPNSERQDLFQQLNLFWRSEDYEGKEQYADNFQNALTLHELDKLKVDLSKPHSVANCFIECKSYYTNEDRVILSFENRNSPYERNVHLLSIPKFAQDMIFAYVDWLFIAAPNDFLEDMINKVVVRICKSDPKLEKSNKYSEQLKIGHTRRLYRFEEHFYKDFYKKEELKKLAAYKLVYEKALKELKEDFKTTYNSLDDKPFRDREKKARKIFLEKHPTLIIEIAKDISLKFKPAEKALLLAARDCCLNPYSKNGRISTQIRESLTKGNHLLEEEEKHFVEAMTKKQTEKNEESNVLPNNNDIVKNSGFI